MNRKINTGSNFAMAQVLEFELVFPNEERLPFYEYLKGGNKQLILKVSTFLLGIRENSTKYKDNASFLQMFFRKENEHFGNYVYNVILEKEKDESEIILINVYSSLKLFEYFFSQEEMIETQTESESEVNLFKAYLALNSEYTKKQIVASESISDLDNDLRVPAMLFSMHFPIADKSNYNIKHIWAAQMVKSIYLFQFLGSHKNARILLDKFLDYFSCKTWQDYLKMFLPLTIPLVKDTEETYTDIDFSKSDDIERNIAFVEKHSVNTINPSDSYDFITLRSKPLYKIDDSSYRVIFDLFVVEKIFKGVYFQLRDVYDRLNKEKKKLINIRNLKSFFGFDFSERVLSYNIIESIYPDNCIRFSGKKIEDLGIIGGPDYYVRRGKNILLFESKDFLLAEKEKMSFDFNIYEKEFGRILDYEETDEGKIKSKAIVQLINNVRSILNEEFTADSDYHYRDVNIYPILITHDTQYDTPGFNDILDSWFQEELLLLKENEGLFINRVHPLSVVNIDTLIIYQHGFLNGYPLHETLKEYHKSKDKKKLKPRRRFKTIDEEELFLKEQQDNIISLYLPFSMFIEDFFGAKKLIQMPKLLDIVVSGLFNE